MKNKSFIIRLPEETIAALKERAKKNDRSVNKEIVHILRAFLGEI